MRRSIESDIIRSLQSRTEHALVTRRPREGAPIIFTIAALRCEFAERPLGLGTAAPRFSWEARSSDRERTASAYQIQVAGTPEALRAGGGLLWDSGRCALTDAPLVEYAGTPLQSRQRAWWKVRLWDDLGRPGPYSDPDWFELALLHAGDWRARWIGHAGSSPRGALYLRRPFVLTQEPRSARLYVTGLGWHEAHLNGRRVGRQVLDPAPTDTSRRVPFTTHDVGELLRKGENVLAGVLGHGWTGSQKLLAQLEIIVDDGSEVHIHTGDGSAEYSWMAFHGPVVEDSIFDGELYDSRLERTGWTDAPADFDAAPMRELFHAMVLDAPGGVLEARNAEAIEVVDTREVAMIAQPLPGIHVVDTGQNLAGWLQLTADGPAGTEITLRYAESLFPDGTVDQRNLRSALARDTLILDGRGPQTWEPAFTYHGFRYVQIDGYPGALRQADVAVRVVRSAMQVRGAFRCDDELVSAISGAVLWTETSNVPGVPTDCPQRNERMGWLNDLAARSEELVHTFDTARFLPKWTQDIADTQDDLGAISDTAPFHFGARPADPVSVCYALIPWLLVTHHGDLRTAARHFDGIRSWYDYLTSRSNGRIVEYSYYGDWAPPAGESTTSIEGVSAVAAHTPGTLISTAHYYLTAVLLERMATALGRPDSGRFAADAADIRTAFHEEFFAGPGVGYGSGNQACNAVALYMGLVPESAVAATLAALTSDIRAHDDHLTTGNLCTKYVLETLFDSRTGGTRTLDREADDIPELGVHARERRDDDLGALGARDRRRHELAQSSDVRVDRRVVLPEARRDPGSGRRRRDVASDRPSAARGQPQRGGRCAANCARGAERAVATRGRGGCDRPPRSRRHSGRPDPAAWLAPDHGPCAVRQRDHGGRRGEVPGGALLPRWRAPNHCEAYVPLNVWHRRRAAM